MKNGENKTRKTKLVDFNVPWPKTGHSESDCHVENHAYQSTFAPVSG